MRTVIFTADDRRALAHYRFHHPEPRIQRKIEVLWLKSHGLGHDQIAAYERPRDAIAWDELPRDETGKLLRRRVRDAIWGESSPFAVGSGDAHTPT